MTSFDGSGEILGVAVFGESMLLELSLDAGDFLGESFDCECEGLKLTFKI